MMKGIFKIIQIVADEVTVETREKEIKKITARLPKFAKPCDFIKHCEHSFYDVVDDKGEIIWR